MVISVLLLPAAPMPLLAGAARALFAELHDALTALDRVLRGGRHDDPAWALHASQRVHVKLAQLAQARITARRIVHVAPRRMRLRTAVHAAAASLDRLDLLAVSMLELLRLTSTALDAGRSLDGDLRAAITELTAVLGALAEHPDAVGVDMESAMEQAARLTSCPSPQPSPSSSRPSSSPDSSVSLIAAMVGACATDLRGLREPAQD